MQNKKSKRVMRAKRKKSIPISWDIELSRSEEVQDLVGVGRTGAPIRALKIPGVSRKSEAQINELGAARIRITKPGFSIKPKPINESKV